jgi:hypothetical protein
MAEEISCPAVFGHGPGDGIGRCQAAGYGTLMESLTETGAEGPQIRVLSLGAGPQSSALLLLACAGHIPAFNAAIFADPGWQHPAVYRRVDQLARIAAGSGIPLYRVSAGDVRADALDTGRRYASMPLWYRSPSGHDGSARRQCVSQYKTRPIKAKIRELLGYPPPAHVPRGIYAELAIGLAAEETCRALDPDVRYLRYAYPLAGLGWTTADCLRYLSSYGINGVPPSACLGCPYHGNRWWRYLRHHEPSWWADVVAFDHAIRNGHPRASDRGQQLRGRYYLHMSRQPLDQAHLGPVRAHNGLPGYAEYGVPGGCSPWTRPVIPALSGPPTAAGEGPAVLIRRHWADAVAVGRAIARRLWQAAASSRQASLTPARRHEWPGDAP